MVKFAYYEYFEQFSLKQKLEMFNNNGSPTLYKCYFSVPIEKGKCGNLNSLNEFAELRCMGTQP